MRLDRQCSHVPLPRPQASRFNVKLYLLPVGGALVGGVVGGAVGGPLGALVGLKAGLTAAAGVSVQRGSGDRPGTGIPNAKTYWEIRSILYELQERIRTGG